VRGGPLSRSRQSTDVEHREQRSAPGRFRRPSVTIRTVRSPRKLAPSRRCRARRQT
jgi:hypothetical protein